MGEREIRIRNIDITQTCADPNVLKYIQEHAEDIEPEDLEIHTRLSVALMQRGISFPILIPQEAFQTVEGKIRTLRTEPKETYKMFDDLVRLVKKSRGDLSEEGLQRAVDITVLVRFVQLPK